MLTLTRHLIKNTQLLINQTKKQLLISQNPIKLLNPFNTINRNWFCTHKNNLRDSPQTFDLLVNYLNEKVNEVNELEQKLIE